MTATGFQARSTGIDGLAVIVTKQVSDERGTVREFYRETTYRSLTQYAAGSWAQINVTHTRLGAIRGLHGEEMTKLIGVVAGEAYGAWVDARPESPTFGVVETSPLAVGVQVLVPRGVLNGFQAVGRDGCEYLYAFDVEWHPSIPGVGVTPVDPELAIPWPVAIDPDDRGLLSAKDAALPLFSALRKQLLGS
ncbi:MAG: dTDP-4-dehydrorhamnose 3,5-epimerase family protein [Acidimicrobiales bacterium]